MTTLLDRDVDKTATYCVVKMATLLVDEQPVV